MGSDFSLDKYVPVAERIVRFYSDNPTGRIHTDPPRIVTVGERTYLEVRAFVWRDQDDPRPCVACAWEPYPGRTPYTRDSEMMNAETSAVGRALGLAGIAVDRSIASSDEIENRRPGVGIPKPEAKGRVLAAAHGDQTAARKAWNLVLPDDPDNVDPHRLEACENVADHLAASETSAAPKRPGNPLKTPPADHAAGLKAARAVLEEATE